MKIKKIFDFVFECEHKVYSFLFLFFIFGLVCGAFYGCKIMSDNVQAYTEVLSNYVLSESIGQVLFKKIILLTIIFLLGYTVIGSPFICFAIMYDGICSGIICGIFTTCYGFKGSIAAIICFYIYFLINVTAIIYVAFSSLRLSLALFNVFKNETKYVSPNVYSKPHIIKFVFFSLFVLLGTFYYVYISRLIYKMIF